MSDSMFNLLNPVLNRTNEITPTGYDNYYNVLAVVLNVMTGVTLFFGILGIVYSAIVLGLEGYKPESANRFKSGLTYSILAIIAAIGFVTLRVVILNTIGAGDSPYLNNLPDY